MFNIKKTLRVITEWMTWMKETLVNHRTLIVTTLICLALLTGCNGDDKGREGAGHRYPEGLVPHACLHHAMPGED